MRRKRRSREGDSSQPERAKKNEDFVGKLGLRGGQVVCLMNPPQGFYARLSNQLPEGSHLYLGLPPKAPAHIFLLWPDGASNLGNALSYLKGMLDPEGAIWTVIPKKKAVRVGTPAIALLEVREAAQRTGLVDDKQMSFSGSQYGIRLVFRRAERRAGAER